jgi:hypothetical protein
MESATAVRVTAADTVTKNTAPIARPSQENCGFCQVKHVCDAYWQAVPPAIVEASIEEWFDFEGLVLGPHGARSWYVETITEPAAQVLVRTVETNLDFPAGKRVRLLGVRRTKDPDDESRLVVSMVRTSEWYAVLT